MTICNFILKVKMFTKLKRKRFKDKQRVMCSDPGIKMSLQGVCGSSALTVCAEWSDVRAYLHLNIFMYSIKRWKSVRRRKIRF